DEVQKQYEKRYRYLEAKGDGRTPEETADFDRLKAAKERGWDSPNKGERAAFLQAEINSGRMKFEFKPGEGGGPGTGRLGGAGIIITVIGSWLITDSDKPEGAPRRSDR